MRRLSLLALALALSGCAFQLEPCATDDDCPDGTTCGRPSGTDVPMCIAPAEAVDGGTVNEPQPDANAAPDVLVPSDANSNASSNSTSPDVDPGECPEVTYCGELEPNDTEDDAIWLNDFPAGCGGFRLEPWSVIHQDSLCAGDTDQFILEYAACDEGAFKITASLTTSDVCLIGGNLDIAESLYSCRDRNVRCEVENGVERIILIIDEQEFPQPVEKLRLAVNAGLADAGVEYILRVTVGR